MAIFTGSGGKPAVSQVIKVTPGIQHVSAPTANTEVTITLPANTVAYRIYDIDTAKIQYSFSSGQSGTIYGIIWAGSCLHEESINPGSVTSIYVQATKITTIVVETWTS